MKKVKQINLLQTKERLKQQKTISHLVQIQSEAEKCLKVSNDLEELARDKAGKSSNQCMLFWPIAVSSKNLWNNVKFY